MINPYASNKLYQCIGCGAWPMGGISETLSEEAAFAIAAKLGVAQKVTAGLVCGPNCLKKYTRAQESKSAV